MRIVHVVTLISDRGAFGGPLRVALNQVGELRARGHDIELVAGWRGSGDLPQAVDGVPVTAVPVHPVVPGTGFSGLYGAGLGRWLRRHLTAADVVHVHAGRDLVSLAALHHAHVAGTPVVVQTHGMIGIDARPQARVLDRLATRRLVGAARLHLVLTEQEARDIATVVPEARVRPLPNGVALPEFIATPPPGANVLFCSRLHPRKRPLAFIEMAAKVVASDAAAATFSLVGPDEGELEAVRHAIEGSGLGGRVRYEGALPYDQVATRVRGSTIFVLSSVDEPFPMALLEAMSLGVPSVCTESCGISDELRRRRAAIVTDPSPDALADAVSSLLGDPALRAETARRGRQAVAEAYSIGSVVDRLEECYREVMAGVE